MTNGVFARDLNRRLEAIESNAVNADVVVVIVVRQWEFAKRFLEPFLGERNARSDVRGDAENVLAARFRERFAHRRECRLRTDVLCVIADHILRDALYVMRVE